jgi:hypothetical protein
VALARPNIRTAANSLASNLSLSNSFVLGELSRQGSSRAEGFLRIELPDLHDIQLESIQAPVSKHQPIRAFIFIVYMLKNI